MSTLPSAGLGALLTLWAFGFDFSVIALIGVILLIGIVKKNGIMIVDFAIAAEREQGLTPEAAILAGIPLMLGHGTGSELRQPLGYAMVGGLLLSQAMTLYTTPVVYLYLDKLNSWLSKQKPETAENPAE